MSKNRGRVAAASGAISWDARIDVLPVEEKDNTFRDVAVRSTGVEIEHVLKCCHPSNSNRGGRNGIICIQLAC